MNEDIQFLTDSEIIIPVLYGHNSSCFDLCKAKILEYRKSGDLSKVIDNVDEDLYTPRTKGRTKEKALEDFKNIANTCKNYLESCSLVISENLGVGLPKKIVLNEGVLEEIQAVLPNKNTFISLNNAESFQRK